MCSCGFSSIICASVVRLAGFRKKARRSCLQDVKLLNFFQYDFEVFLKNETVRHDAVAFVYRERMDRFPTFVDIA